MKTYLKNSQFIYFEGNEFKIFNGTCIITNALVTGFDYDIPKDLSSEDIVIDMNNKVVMPMFANLDCNLEESLFKTLDKSWNYEYFKNMYNFFMSFSKEKSNKYYEELAITSTSNAINNGIGLLQSKRCWECQSLAPIYSLVGYPIANSALLREYLNLDKLDETLKIYNKSNLIHGLNLESLYFQDNGSLELAKKTLSKFKFLSIPIGINNLSKNLSLQKWQNTELKVLEKYNLLNQKTLLLTCSVLDESDLTLIHNSMATVILSPVVGEKMKNNPASTPISPYEFQKKNIDWCLSSKSLAFSESMNVIKLIQETQKMFPELTTSSLLKATCITPITVLKKILNVDISRQANFTIIDAKTSFGTINDFFNWLLAVNANDVNFELMMNGNIVSYDKTDKLAEYREFIKQNYKHFEDYFTNPNMFLSEIKKCY